MNLLVIEVFSNHHCHLLTRNAVQMARSSGTHLSSKRCRSMSGPKCKEPNPILWGHWALPPHTDTSLVPLRFPLMYQNKTWQQELGLWKRSAATESGSAHSISAKKCHRTDGGKKVYHNNWTPPGVKLSLQKLCSPRKIATSFCFNILTLSSKLPRSSLKCAFPLLLSVKPALTMVIRVREQPHRLEASTNKSKLA